MLCCYKFFLNQLSVVWLRKKYNFSSRCWEIINCNEKWRAENGNEPEDDHRQQFLIANIVKP